MDVLFMSSDFAPFRSLSCFTAFVFLFMSYGIPLSCFFFLMVENWDWAGACGVLSGGFSCFFHQCIGVALVFLGFHCLVCVSLSVCITFSFP